MTRIIWYIDWILQERKRRILNIEDSQKARFGRIGPVCFSEHLFRGGESATAMSGNCILSSSIFAASLFLFRSGRSSNSYLYSNLRDEGAGGARIMRRSTVGYRSLAPRVIQSHLGVKWPLVTGSRPTDSNLDTIEGN